MLPRSIFNTQPLFTDVERKPLRGGAREHTMRASWGKSSGLSRGSRGSPQLTLVNLVPFERPCYQWMIGWQPELYALQ